MEKLVVFPLNNDTEILINGLKESKLYQIVAVSSYIEDKSRLELLQKKSSIYCSTEFEECLARADAIIFAENTMGYSYDGYQKRVQMALDSGKKIYAGLALLDKIQIDKDKVCILQESTSSDEVVSSDKKEIDIPVVSVMGLGENCDKFGLQVKIKKVIEKQGYRVLALCSNVLGGFLGMENFPSFLYSKFMSYPEKINALNQWIYEKVIQQEYDVILVGCPGGISEFEKYETNYYGELPLIISNALDVDAGFATLYGHTALDYSVLKNISDFVLKKYNTSVKDYILSRQFYKADHEWKKIRYYTIEENMNEELAIPESSEYQVLSIFDDAKIEKEILRILEEFANNIFVI
jgi:peptide maturation system protein (TIGR04066 family)